MKLIFALCVLLVALPTHAVNLRFLKHSVLSEFSDSEVKEFKIFIRGALDELEDNKTVVWRASESPLAGKFKSEFTYQSNGTTCRRSLFLITNHVKKEPFRFEICKNGNIWQIQDTPAMYFGKEDWEVMRESLVQTLDQEAIGAHLSWSNKHSGHKGTQVALSIDRDAKKACTALAISIFDMKGRTANGIYTFCKDLTLKPNDQIWVRQAHSMGVKF